MLLPYRKWFGKGREKLSSCICCSLDLRADHMALRQCHIGGDRSILCYQVQTQPTRWRGGTFSKRAFILKTSTAWFKQCQDRRVIAVSLRGSTVWASRNRGSAFRSAMLGGNNMGGSTLRQNGVWGFRLGLLCSLLLLLYIHCNNILIICRQRQNSNKCTLTA